LALIKKNMTTTSFCLGVWGGATVQLLRESGINFYSSESKDCLGDPRVYIDIAGSNAKITLVSSVRNATTYCTLHTNASIDTTNLREYESFGDWGRRWLLPLLLERAPEVFPAISHELK
jgi:hypothetical protein